jgi:hypothetical protein
MVRDVEILGADQKDRGLRGEDCGILKTNRKSG